jgi:DNA-binding NarL/FixJ family response regulator
MSNLRYSLHMPIKVLIIEDNRPLQLALKSLIELSSDIVCVGESNNCPAEISFSADQIPDVVLMDIDLPGVNGIDCTKKIKVRHPFVNVLILTVIESTDKIMEAICAGAAGYLMKSAEPEKILDSIRVVFRGGSPLTPSVARKIFENIYGEQGNPQKIPLNKREYEVLKGLVDGLSYKMIAAKHFISIDTVRTYIRSIYEKMEVHSRSEAVARAFKDKLF